MDCEGVLTVPQAVVAAAGCAAVLTVAAAAVLTAGAAGAAEARTDAAAGWQALAARVVESNARIRMLAERVRHADARVRVPEPLRLDGCTLAQAASWCEQAARLLATAHEAMRAATVSGAGGRDGAYPCDAIVRTLDADANEREHLEILNTAAAAAAQDVVRAEVVTVNARVARRRLAAQWLAALEHPLAAEAEPPGPILGTSARLRAVVAGDDDLDPRLRAEGREAVAWAAQVARLHFIRELLRDRLADQGYAAEDESVPCEDPELRLTRAEWRGEHCAEIWVDRHGALHGRLVSEGDPDMASGLEIARRAEFNAHVVALGHALGADVVIDDGYVPRHRAFTDIEDPAPEAP